MPTVIDRTKLPRFESGLQPRDFVIDYTTYYFETNNEDAAHYLCVVLGSNVINEAVKSFQPRRLYGKRDIGRRPFQPPIPLYDERNPIQTHLTELSKNCHSIIESTAFPRSGFRSMRNHAKKVLHQEIDEIDKKVEILLAC